MIYAIQNKRTKRFYFGTDYRFEPPRQRTDPEFAKLFYTKDSAEVEFKVRKINREYKIVPVKIEIIKQEDIPIIEEIAENTNYIIEGFE